MTFKKTISIFMALILLLSVLVPCFPAKGTENEPHDHIWQYDAAQHWGPCSCGEPLEKTDHTYGDWSYDTAQGTQTRSCTVCGYADTLYGTDNKVSQVAEPAVGESYYLAANVAGTINFFVFEGKVTDTTPYSLHTTADISNANIKQITLEAPVEGTTGFQMTFYNGADLTRIYCYDVLTTGANSGVMDTGTNKAKYLNRHTFFVDEVDGVKVLRKIGNDNILVVKYNETKGEWRMLGVPESELANAGVYPAMLVNVHTHDLDAGGYAYNKDQHWKVCDCGLTQTPEDHSFVMDEALGYETCQCGASLQPHDCQSTDGKWYEADGKHYQLCGTCGEKVNTADHAYGTWSFDAEKGIQTRSCVCGNTETLYGTDTKVSQVETPTVGESYYLAANVNGQLLSFLANGGYTSTTPYSLKTSTTLSKVTLNAALEAGQGEFQLVEDGGKYIYSVAAGAGATTSSNYITNPARVSFLMDQVNGQTVIRAYGTQNILVVKYSDAMAAWRMWCLPEAELANEGVYPVMLVNVHTHSFDAVAYEYNSTQHWQKCDCDYTTAPENHTFVMDEALGYEVCVCGAAILPHDCESEDGKWYEADGKHHQLCGTCNEPINIADHVYGQWTFDAEKGTQSRSCDCGGTETLYGTDTKVSQAADPTAGESYYLAANANGTVYFFFHGTVSDTSPCSLVTTTNFANTDLRQVTLETPVSGNTGFQITYLRPSDDKQLRIYCYDSVGSDGVMDTGANSTSELSKHTFFVDEVDGVKVLRKVGNNHILVLKYNESIGAWRMLGVEEAELANEGVYPVMLVNAHTHSFASDAYAYNKTEHWKTCDCGSAGAPESHSFSMDEALGYEVCVCGASIQPHDCESEDGKWYEADGKHYQLCGTCNEKINTADHTYGQWNFDTENSTQSRSCSACGYVHTLHGADTKVTQITDPVVDKSYYLAANVDGTVYFFRHGTVTDTSPVSLVTTDNVNHEWAFPLTIETAVEGSIGFQITYTHPTTGNTIRVYCYDSVGSDGVMDTGANGKNELNNHTFCIDEVNGVKVLRKIGNNHILVVKYNESVGAWRMLGVPESELANEGVYPAMLVDVHTHSHDAAVYQSDSTGHWYACQCGGKSDYAEHTVAQWTVTAAPTETTAGSKTGVCTLCGATAIKEMPPVLPDGYYYLTGTLDGVQYYYRSKTGNESVEHTVPFSLHSANQKKDAMQVNILWDEQTNTYTISYSSPKQLNLYMGDVNGSTVKKDGKVDLSSSSTTAAALIAFSWDPVNKILYQMENGVKYVMAFKRLTNTSTNQQEVRLMALPESELGADAVMAKLEVIHQHSYSEKWSCDAINHWKECDCGVRKQEEAHTVTQWTVEKEATAYSAGSKSGVCSVCGETVVNAIPMLNDNVKAPENGGKYYLTAVLDGVRYYFRHAPSGGSVADTVPYSLYTDTASGKVNALTARVEADQYNLYYGTKDYHLYINGNGVGITTASDNESLVDFLWDAENKLLYQVENGVKHVLVFKYLKNSKTGETNVRITSMPMDQALIDPSVAIAQLTTEGPAPVEETEKDQNVISTPAEATPLDTVVSEEAPDNVQGDGDRTAIAFDYISPENNTAKTVLIAVAVFVGILAVLAILLIALRNTAFVIGFFRRWNLWSGAFILLSAVLLVGAMLLPGAAEDQAVALSEFAIVTEAENMVAAHELAVTLQEEYSVSLPVVQSKDYQGSRGIYLNLQGKNSYGGYKYSVLSEKNGDNLGVFINGTGASLDTAIEKWLKSVKTPDAFPFGQKEEISGYEWNTDDINMTGLGFSLKETERTELDVGVELRKLTYESFGYGKVSGYAVIVDSDAQVELKVAAGEWDENTSTENPGTKYTVGQYGEQLTEEGYEVIAITNAGFYDLNTTMTYIPWGMQIVDGYVRKEPNEDNPNNTDNWFAQTADGKFVISNTAGYYETYETTLAQGVGGGRVLMRNGAPCFSSTSVDYRTVVGITKAGDLIILTMPSANYAFATQVFMDMDMDVDCILNLDGGGSTTLHALDGNGNLSRLLCETPIEREVADAIAIVKKK